MYLFSESIAYAIRFNQSTGNRREIEGKLLKIRLYCTENVRKLI